MSEKEQRLIVTDEEVEELITVIVRNMKRVRKLKNISQQKLSEITGVNKAYISRVERNNTGFGVQYLLKIALAMGVTLDQLVPINEQGNIEEDKVLIAFQDIMNGLDDKQQEVVMELLAGIVNLKYGTK